MTDKQNKAIKIILDKYYHSKIDSDEAIELIDSIVGNTIIQYVPSYPYWWHISQNDQNPWKNTYTTTGVEWKNYNKYV